VVGVLVIAGIIWLLYIKHKRRNSVLRAKNSPNAARPQFEVEEKARYELSPNEKRVYELTGGGYVHEATDSTVRAEADRANMVVTAVELPATNFSEKGRWGIPLIKVPSDTTLAKISNPQREEDGHSGGEKKDSDLV
jgi:hypothetical protein